MIDPRFDSIRRTAIVRRFVLASVWLCLLAGTACGGTPNSPAAGPVEPPSLTDAEMRCQAISFFLIVLLLSAVVVRWQWNRLAKDFPRLPRIDYVKSSAIVVLWGLLCLVVLTMIAGTRELMEPGIWRHDGLLYEVADGSTDAPQLGWTSAIGLLLVGWIGFLYRTLPHVSIRPAGVISAVVVFGLCIALIDYLARWSCRAMSDGADDRRKHWRLAWSLSIVIAVVVMFVAGLSAIGAARQVGWLLASR